MSDQPSPIHHEHPPSSLRFNVRHRFRIVSADGQVAYAAKLAAAKLIAGEWQIERDRSVEIIRQHGLPKRWRATFIPDTHTVKLSPLYSDGVPDDAGSRRQRNLAAYIERERNRRRMALKRRRQRQARAADPRCIRRAVVCLNPVKSFASLADAARWLNIRQPQTLTVAIRHRHGRCGGFTFAYADELLEAIDPELRAAAIAACAQAKEQPYVKRAG